MRARNSIISSVFGIVNVSIRLIVSLVMRKVFLNYFGAEYLGIYFIFDSIFGVLIALDCGVSSSVFLKIYKPLEDGDYESITSVFNLVKLVYTIRGLLVCFVGAIIYFFLPNIIQETTLDFSFIKKCYIIYALCNSFNYLVIFYQFFLESVQKRYLVSLIELPLYFIEILLQLLGIIILKNYLFYLLITSSTAVILNIVCMVVTYKKYPYLRKSHTIKQEDKKGFIPLLGMAFHSLSSVISKYTDTFLISVFSGVVQTGLYGNYKTLNTTVLNFVNQITSSTKDPFRSIIASEDNEKIQMHLGNLNFLMYWIGSFSCVGLASLSSRFINLWLGKEFVLSIDVVITTSIALFLSIQSFFIVDAYYTTYSFQKDKKSPIIEIIVNIIFSCILGKEFGITGIMIGTVLYYIVQIFLRSYRLYNILNIMTYYKSFLLKIFSYFLSNLLITLTITITFSKVSFSKNKIIDFLISLILILIVPNLFNFFVYQKTSEFLYFKDFIFRIIKRFRGRNNG